MTNINVHELLSLGLSGFDHRGFAVDSNHLFDLRRE